MPGPRPTPCLMKLSSLSADLLLLFAVNGTERHTTPATLQLVELQ